MIYLNRISPHGRIFRFLMFNEVFKNKKVLITGHTGFKGSWLTLWLNTLGAKVIGYSIDVPTRISLFNTLSLENVIDHNLGDVRNISSFKKIVLKHKPDFIFHLAAQPLVKKSYINPTETMTTNILGVNNILDIMRSYDKKCSLVIITSDKCYDNLELKRGYHENDILGGKDPYSASKGAAELVFKGYFNSFFKDNPIIRIATARAGNVIGGGDWAEDRIVPDCIRAWQKNNTVKIRYPNSTRPWQHVLEPLSGYLILASKLYQSKKFSGESFNFGPDTISDYTVVNLIDELQATFFHGDIFANQPYIADEDPTFHEAGLLKLDCKKSNKDLDWIPTLNFKETAYFTAFWYREYKRMDPMSITMDQIDNFTDLLLNKPFYNND